MGFFALTSFSLFGAGNPLPRSFNSTSFSLSLPASYSFVTQYCSIFSECGMLSRSFSHSSSLTQSAKMYIPNPNDVKFSSYSSILTIFIQFSRSVKGWKLKMSDVGKMVLSSPEVYSFLKSGHSFPIEITSLLPELIVPTAPFLMASQASRGVWAPDLALSTSLSKCTTLALYQKKLIQTPVLSQMMAYLFFSRHSSETSSSSSKLISLLVCILSEIFVVYSKLFF